MVAAVCVCVSGCTCVHVQMHTPHRALLLLGWSKTSHSLEAPEEDGGWSSAEELINSSDAEEDGGVGPRKLVPGKYTVVMDDEKGGSDTLAMRSGDMVEVVEEGTEGLWYVRDLTSSKEGWVPASSLATLLGKSSSAQCLSSSGKTHYARQLCPEPAKILSPEPV